MLRRLSAAPVLRFGVVGVAMSALHLVVFHLVAGRLVAELANLVAFLVVTQVNFVVSDRFTWASRRVATLSTRELALRVLAFNGTAASGFALNALAFSAAYRLLGAGDTASAVVGVLAGAGATFLLSSRLVFRRAAVAPAPALAPAPH